MADKPLVLVDGSSYLFRAYHAMPDLRTSDNTSTGAVRGVISMLRKLAKDYEGSPIAVVFDAKGKTFRDELYPDYKGNRPPMPDDLREQIEPIHQIIRAMGLPVLVVPNVEADDVIGTLARQAARAGVETLIVTGDSDLLQLIEPGVRVAISGRRFTDSRVYDAAAVEARYGIGPGQLVEWKALKGDSSDNIPGVPGIGEKTATDLIQRFGDIEAAIARAEEIPGRRVRENLV
ncbi:MAG: DNA polymerase I, partial [Pseudomonadales bacterium]|nr:DNA polymerase I [Pseudomonadales bacterium]